MRADSWSTAATTSWDNNPEEGIRWNWQRVLQLADDVFGNEYPYLVTQTTPCTLEALARHVLEIVRPLGQNGVNAIGNPQQEVSRVATDTGVSTDALKMTELGAVVGILTDDDYLHVRMGEQALELGFTAIVGNHGVAEEPGIKALTAYIVRQFPAADVFHLPQRCPYQVLTG